MEDDINAIWLTLQLATITTIILLLVAIPIAWWLTNTRHHAFKPVIITFIALPLVLPPTVLGFYLLILFGPEGTVGRITNALGMEPLVFSFSGLVVASVLYSLPFAVQPIHNAFEAIGKDPLEAAATLRASPLDRFFHVVLPLAWPGILTALILSFAHTVGEFGVVLMIGGNIPDETKVLSIAIYDHVESLEYEAAHILSAGMVAFSFFILLLLYYIRPQKGNQ